VEEKNKGHRLKEGHPLKDLEVADVHIETKDQEQSTRELTLYKSKVTSLSGYYNLNRFQKLLFLSGVFDGEGSFGLWGAGYKRKKRFQLKIETTDQDMVFRFKDFFKFGSLHTRAPRNGLKPTYTWAIKDHKAWRVLNLMIPYMCNRRQEKFYGLAKSFEHGSKNWGSYIQKQTRRKEVDE